MGDEKLVNCGEVSTWTLTEVMGGLPTLTVKLKPPIKLYAVNTYYLDLVNSSFKNLGYKKGFMIEYVPGFRTYLLIDPSDYYDYYDSTSNSKSGESDKSSRGMKLGDKLSDSIKTLCSESFELEESDAIKNENESKLKYYWYTGTKYQNLVKLCNSIKDKVWGISRGKIRFFDRVISSDLKGEDTIVCIQPLSNIHIDHNFISDTIFEGEDTDNAQVQNLRAGKSINIPIPSLANDYVDFTLLRSRLQHSIYDTRPYAEVRFNQKDPVKITYDSTKGYSYRYKLGQVVTFTEEDYLAYNFPFRITQVSYEFNALGDVTYYCVARSYNCQDLYSSIDSKSKDGGGLI